MKKRPLCIIFLLMASGIFILDALGLPLIHGNPLPEAVKAAVVQYSEADLEGTVYRTSESEFGCSLWLKSVRLLVPEGGSYSLGRVRVYCTAPSEAVPGNRVIVHGKLSPVPVPTNPGEFDSRQYYACQHIYYFLKKAHLVQICGSSFGPEGFLSCMRSGLQHILREAAGKDSPVFEAILLGDKSGLDEELRLRYQMTGIIHILAISGLHISLLGMGIFKILKRMHAGLALSTIAALSFIVLFGMMTGASVSALRAVCMFLVRLGAGIAGRSYDLLSALALAGILLILETPAWLDSSSFLLSFSAVAGISILGPALSSIYRNHKKNRTESWPSPAPADHIIPSLLSSLAVWLFTLPVQLWYHGEVSLAGIILNLVVLPTAGILLGSGAAALAAGFLSKTAAVVMLAPGRLILYIYGALCTFFTRLPFCSVIPGQPSGAQLILYILLLMTGIFLLNTKNREDLPGSNPGEMKQAKRPFCHCCGILMLSAALPLILIRVHTGLTITCLDVGQGDGILIQSDNGGAFLIDGGSTSRSSVGKNQILPHLKNQGISTLEGVFVSHTDEDHINGLQELMALTAGGLSGIRIRTLYLPGWEDPPEAWLDLAALAKACHAEVICICRGDELQCGKLKIKALAPEPGDRAEDVNESGMVLLARYGNFTGLFTGDIGTETEEALLKDLPDIDFLKVAHHGSRYSSSEAFLRHVRPEIGVISCALQNRYGHPSQETVERLRAAGCSLSFTMKSGAVILHTDGMSIRVKGWLDG